MPEPVIDGLRQRGWKFYTFIGARGCRLMCAWDTREEDVVAFAKDIAELAGKSADGSVRANH